MTRDELRKPLMRAMDAEEVEKIMKQDMFLINSAYGFLRSKPEVKTFNSGMIIPETMAETINKEIKRKERKEYNKMYSNNKYFNEIKDILQIAEMTVEHSIDNCNERVRIEGFVNCEDLLKKKKQETMGIPKPVGIIRRGKATIVTWADKTKTTIVLEDKQADLDIFHTFCIAFTKKMLGSTTAILDTIEKNDTDTIERKKKEAREAAEKKNKELVKSKNELIEKLRFEKAVQEKMLEQRAYDEAIRRIIAQADKKFEQMSEGVVEAVESAANNTNPVEE